MGTEGTEPTSVTSNRLTSRLAEISKENTEGFHHHLWIKY
jgi:hypothetical protein